MISVCLKLKFHNSTNLLAICKFSCQKSSKNFLKFRLKSTKKNSSWQKLFPLLTAKRHELFKDRISGQGFSENLTIPDTFQWSSLIALMRPYFWILLAAIITAVLAAILNIQIPLQLGELINVSLELENGSQISALFQPALNLLSLYGAQSIITTCYISLLSLIGERIARDVRIQLFHSLIYQDVDFFDRRRTGELVSRLSTDVQEFKSCFKQTISQGLKSFTQLVGCSISLYLISPKMTIITMVLVPALVIVGTSLGAVLRQISKQAQKQVALLTAVSDEALGNIRTVKAFAMEETEEKIYKRELDHSRYLNEILGVGVGVFQGLSNLVLNGIVLGVIYGGTHLMIAGEISPGQLMSFLATSQVIQKSLAQMSLLFGQVIKGTSAAGRIFEYIDKKPQTQIDDNQIIWPDCLKGQVRFENITFSYPSRPDFTVLDDFSLLIPSGKIVALCGLSGGGKSTVAALLERFYDVDGGKISIDGIDIRQLDKKWLRGKAIGFISQEPVLFHSTIAENIRYGKPDATDKEVYVAAKTANADHFIRSFPHGYKTIVGERGVTLSGGQKQRIAIARALLKNPPILILDEATSALDTESERLVQEALEKAEKGRTVLMIAHRLSTLKKADYIAVVADKKIAEIGTHSSLMRLKGHFWRFTQQQNDSE